MTKEEATKFLENIPDVNYGGCLVAAYAFWLHEKQNGRGKGLKIVELNDGSDCLRHNKSFIKNGCKGFADSDAHFGWSYDNGKTVFDSEGKSEIPRSAKRFVIPQKYVKPFCTASLNGGGWNWQFDRTNQLPKIAKALEVDLSEINLSQDWDTFDGCGGNFKK